MESKNGDIDEHEEVVEAERRFRRICMKIAGIDPELESSRKQIEKNSEKPPKKQLFANAETRRLRPSVIDRAFQKSPVVSSTPMPCAKNRHFMPSSAGSLSPIDTGENAQPVAQQKTRINSSTQESCIVLSSLHTFSENVRSNKSPAPCVSVDKNEPSTNKTLGYITKSKNLDKIVAGLLQAEAQSEQVQNDDLNTSTKTVQTSLNMSHSEITKKMARGNFLLNARERQTQTGVSLERNAERISESDSIISQCDDELLTKVIHTGVEENNKSVKKKEQSMNVGKPWRVQSDFLHDRIVPMSDSLPPVDDSDDDSFLPKQRKQKKVFKNKKKLSKNRKNTSVNKNRKSVSLPAPRTERSRNKTDDGEVGSSTFLRKRKVRNNSGRLQEIADKIARTDKDISSAFQRADEKNDTKNDQKTKNEQRVPQDSKATNGKRDQPSTSQESSDMSSFLRSPRQKKTQNTSGSGRLQKVADRIVEAMGTNLEQDSVINELHETSTRTTEGEKEIRINEDDTFLPKQLKQKMSESNKKLPKNTENISVKEKQIKKGQETKNVQTVPPQSKAKDRRSNQASTSQETTDVSSVLRSPRQKKAQKITGSGRLQNVADRIVEAMGTNLEQGTDISELHETSTRITESEKETRINEDDTFLPKQLKQKVSESNKKLPKNTKNTSVKEKQSKKGQKTKNKQTVPQQPKAKDRRSDQASTSRESTDVSSFLRSPRQKKAQNITACGRLQNVADRIVEAMGTNLEKGTVNEFHEASTRINESGKKTRINENDTLSPKQLKQKVSENNKKLPKNKKNTSVKEKQIKKGQETTNKQTVPQQSKAKDRRSDQASMSQESADVSSFLRSPRQKKTQNITGNGRLQNVADRVLEARGTNLEQDTVNEFHETSTRTTESRKKSRINEDDAFSPKQLKQKVSESNKKLSKNTKNTSVKENHLKKGQETKNEQTALQQSKAKNQKSDQLSTSQESTDVSSFLRSPRQKKAQNTSGSERLQKVADRISEATGTNLEQGTFNEFHEASTVSGKETKINEATFGETFNGGRRRINNSIEGKKADKTVKNKASENSNKKASKRRKKEETVKDILDEVENFSGKRLNISPKNQANRSPTKSREKNKKAGARKHTSVVLKEETETSDVRRSTRTRRPVTRPTAGVLLLKSENEIRRYERANALLINDSLSSKSVRKSLRVSKTRNRKTSFTARNRKTFNQIATSSTIYPVREEAHEATIEAPTDFDSGTASSEEAGRKTKEGHGVKTGRISKRQTAKLSQKNIRTSLENMKNTGPDGMLSTLNICEGDKVRTIKWVFKNLSFKEVKSIPGIRTAVFDGVSQGMVRIEAGQSKPKQIALNHLMTFNVHKGQAEVGVQDKSSVCNEGESFLVPPGGQYYIKNLSCENDLQLFFTKFPKTTFKDS